MIYERWQQKFVATRFWMYIMFMSGVIGGSSAAVYFPTNWIMVGMCFVLLYLSWWKNTEPLSEKVKPNETTKNSMD